MTTIPYGYCRCGCGRKTKIATGNLTCRGHVKGEPQPFVFGHRQPWSERFAYTVEDHGHITPCHVWAGSIDTKTGYGRLHMRGRYVIASRFVYEQEHGKLPPWPACHVDHLCRVPSCVRLDHLEAVTGAENIRRGAGATLTDQQADEIRLLCLAGWVQRDIAAAYGVSFQHVSALHCGTRRQTQGGIVHAAAA